MNEPHIKIDTEKALSPIRINEVCGGVEVVDVRRVRAMAITSTTASTITEPRSTSSNSNCTQSTEIFILADRSPCPWKKKWSWPTPPLGFSSVGKVQTAYHHLRLVGVGFLDDLEAAPWSALAIASASLIGFFSGAKECRHADDRERSTALAEGLGAGEQSDAEQGDCAKQHLERNASLSLPECLGKDLAVTGALRSSVVARGRARSASGPRCFLDPPRKVTASLPSTRR